MTISTSDFGLRYDESFSSKSDTIKTQMDEKKNRVLEKEPDSIKSLESNFVKSGYLSNKEGIESPINAKKSNSIKKVLIDFSNDKLLNNNLEDKMAIVAPNEKSKNVYKYSLEKGDCEINYRFKADIEKSNFGFAHRNNPKEYAKNKDFFFVNGINTTDKESKSTAKELSKITGQNVKPIYNPTEGIGKDLLEVAIQRLSDSTFDSVTKKTALSFYSTLSSGKTLKVVAHSQGAAITSDALRLCKEMLLAEAQKPFPNGNTLHYRFPYAENKIIANKKPLIDVDNIMKKVEVITMGGAASQDKFPNIKLVEIVNPKDPVPKVGGSDLIQTSIIRKTVTEGKISYVKNPKDLSNMSNFMLNKTIQNVATGALGIVDGIVSLVKEKVNGKSLIDYHKVTDGNEAYLKNNNVKSLLYNFGRQDFKELK